jgi:hypothetical protein
VTHPVAKVTMAGEARAHTDLMTCSQFLFSYLVRSTLSGNVWVSTRGWSTEASTPGRAELAELGGVPVEQLCDDLLQRVLPGPADYDVGMLAVCCRSSHPQVLVEEAEDQALGVGGRVDGRSTAARPDRRPGPHSRLNGRAEHPTGGPPCALPSSPP